MGDKPDDPQPPVPVVPNKDGIKLELIPLGDNPTDTKAPTPDPPNDDGFKVRPPKFDKHLTSSGPSLSLRGELYGLGKPLHAIAPIGALSDPRSPEIPLVLIGTDQTPGDHRLGIRFLFDSPRKKAALAAAGLVFFLGTWFVLRVPNIVDWVSPKTPSTTAAAAPETTAGSSGGAPATSAPTPAASAPAASVTPATNAATPAAPRVATGGSRAVFTGGRSGGFCRGGNLTGIIVSASVAIVDHIMTVRFYIPVTGVEDRLYGPVSGPLRDDGTFELHGENVVGDRLTYAGTIGTQAIHGTFTVGDASGCQDTWDVVTTADLASYGR